MLAPALCIVFERNRRKNSSRKAMARNTGSATHRLKLGQNYSAIAQHMPDGDRQRSRKTRGRLRWLVSPRHVLECSFLLLIIVGQCFGQWNRIPQLTLHIRCAQDASQAQHDAGNGDQSVGGPGARSTHAALAPLRGPEKRPWTRRWPSLRRSGVRQGCRRLRRRSVRLNVLPEK